jgi:outer membrane protein assembly factor BamB
LLLDASSLSDDLHRKTINQGGIMTHPSHLRLKSLALFVGSALACIAQASPFEAGDSLKQLPDWATHNGNAQHTGYVPMSTKPSTFQVKWTKKLPVTGGLNIAATGGGNAYVSNTVWFATGYLFALSLVDGSVRWSHEYTSPTYGGIPIMNAPAYHNGMAYVSTGGHEDAALWGYDATTGVQAFRAQISAQWETYYAPTPLTNTLYMNGGSYGGAYGFIARDGATRFFTGLPQYDHWTPAVDDSYVYAYTTQLDILDRRTGVIVKTISDPNFEWWGYSVGCAPVIGDRRDIIVVNAHRMVSFNLDTHSISWVQAVDAGYYDLNQLSLANGTIYYGSGNTVSMRDEADGHLLSNWIAPNGATVESTVVVTSNMFFVSTSGGTYAVDRKNPTGYRWQTAAHGQLSLSREGVLLISGTDGVVTAIQVHS